MVMICKECDNTKIVALGLCSQHYYKQRYEKMKNEVCILEGCNTRRNSTTGYCSFHYTSKRVLGSPEARGMPGEFCKQGHHNMYKTLKNGSRVCLECRRGWDRARSKTEHRRRQQKDRNLRSRFGITLDEYETLLQDQNQRCAICNDVLTDGKGGACVDHCHTSGRVRAILCSPCNKGIGYIKEDLDRVAAIMRYLRETPN